LTELEPPLKEIRFLAAELLEISPEIPETQQPHLRIYGVSKTVKR